MPVLKSLEEIWQIDHELKICLQKCNYIHWIKQYFCCMSSYLCSVSVVSHLEVEDAGILWAEALSRRNHSAQNLRVQSQRGDGSQQPAVTWCTQQVTWLHWSQVTELYVCVCVCVCVSLCSHPVVPDRCQFSSLHQQWTEGQNTAPDWTRRQVNTLSSPSLSSLSSSSKNTGWFSNFFSEA